jgi:hypothetical protein
LPPLDPDEPEPPEEKVPLLPPKLPVRIEGSGSRVVMRV